MRVAIAGPWIERCSTWDEVPIPKIPSNRTNPTCQKSSGESDWDQLFWVSIEQLKCWLKLYVCFLVDLGARMTTTKKVAELGRPVPVHEIRHATDRLRFLASGKQVRDLVHDRF